MGLGKREKEDFQWECSQMRFERWAMKRQMTNLIEPLPGQACECRLHPAKLLPKQALPSAGVVPSGGGVAPVEPVPPAPRLRRRELKATFDGDPKNLPYFLVQVGANMSMMDDEYTNNAERVNNIGALLEGKAMAWLVGLFEEDAPKRHDFDCFMISLCCCFEDPFLKEKARAKLQRLHQGSRMVANCWAESTPADTTSGSFCIEEKRGT
uniref:Uncharacterized protein n=1 Tax=Sphaerodactylus townsendi TaxID=933632 RepID=A0ACB8FCS5_9SAUR